MMIKTLSSVISKVYIPIILGVTLLQSGCVTTGKSTAYLGPGRVQEWPYKPWSEAYVYESESYVVRTNTSPETAEYIGELMDTALISYRDVMGHKGESLPVLRVNAYALRSEYEAVAKKQGFPDKVTEGLYTSAPIAVMHLPYTADRKKHPAHTLVHEGTHQFLDWTMRFKVPQEAKALLPPMQYKVVSVPLWLNEGLASYMESSVVNEDQIQVGRINRQKLEYLQKLMRKGRAPSLRSVLSKPYGKPFSTSDYAVSWGIVYVLNETPEGRRKLWEFLEAAKQGFYSDPDLEFMEDFVPDGKLVSDFMNKWYSHASQKSPLFFERIIVGEGSTLEEWEEDWTERVSRIRVK